MISFSNALSTLNSPTLSFYCCPNRSTKMAIRRVFISSKPISDSRLALLGHLHVEDTSHGKSESVRGVSLWSDVRKRPSTCYARVCYYIITATHAIWTFMISASNFFRDRYTYQALEYLVDIACHGCRGQSTSNRVSFYRQSMLKSSIASSIIEADYNQHSLRKYNAINIQFLCQLGQPNLKWALL